MRAAVLREFHRFPAVETVPDPVAGPGEVVVRVRASALCSSDLHIVEGKIPTVRLPFTPGHELAGEIVEVGRDVTELQTGQHVIAALDVTCGHCRYCLSGRGNVCPNLKRIGFELDGAHAEYVKLPARNTIPVPDRISFPQAAAISDAVATMYRAIKIQGRARLGDRVLLLGVGGLGIHGVQLARALGATVFCTDVRDEKLAKARELGADLALNPLRDDVPAAIRDVTGGDGVDVALDLIGTRETMTLAIDLCARGGRAVVVGYATPAFEAPFYSLLMQEKSIVGTRASTRQDVTDAVGLVASGRITPVVGSLYPLEGIGDAMEALRSGTVMGRAVMQP